MFEYLEELLDPNGHNNPSHFNQLIDFDPLTDI